MAAKYFAGKTGYATIEGFPAGRLKISSWNYVDDNNLVEITNTRSYGKQQFIGNLQGGTITCDGYMTDDLLNNLKPGNNQLLFGGKEVVFDLYLDYDAFPKLGFTDIDAIIDDLTYGFDVNGVATFQIKANINEPKE